MLDVLLFFLSIKTEGKDAQLNKYGRPTRICRRGQIRAASENTIGAFESAYEHDLKDWKSTFRTQKTERLTPDLIGMAVGDPLYAAFGNSFRSV